MDDSTIIFIILGCFVVMFLIGCICYAVHMYRYNKVTETSELVSKLKELNGKYEFDFSIKREYSFRYSCPSKYKFDKTSVDDYFYMLIQENMVGFKSLLDKLNNNEKLLHQYNDEYKSLSSTATKEQAKKAKVPYKSYLKNEQKFYEKERLSPPIQTDLYCEVTYTSPAGRNFYRNYNIYDRFDLQTMIDRVSRDISIRQSTAYKKKIERAKLTDSLRYDVMRRDGFRCVLCGNSVEDGYKLHVDHIIPISRGGQTELSNLRTLCERCNLGKSDKIESAVEVDVLE